MKQPLKTKTSLPQPPQQAASARLVLLTLVSFLAGVAATALWFERPANHQLASSALRLPDESTVGWPAPPPPALPTPANPLPMDPGIAAEVTQSVPNFASISLKDGEGILRAAALQEFAAASKAMDEQVSAAQQQLQAARDSLSPDAQQQAMNHLQETQAAAAEKLKAIAARLQARIAVLKTLKAQP